MLLVEDGKANIVERRTIDGREWIYILTSSHELFSVVEPEVGEDVLEYLREMARDALRGEGRRVSGAGTVFFALFASP